MKVLMLLENQWFKDPPRMRRLLATHYENNRSEFIRTFLFFGCMSGKRIQAAFGDRWTDRDAAIWEETSPQMGSYPGEKFPADMEHLRTAFLTHRPDVVVAFGKTACDALAWMGDCDMFGGLAFGIIKCPHPAARQDDVPTRLRAAAALLNEYAARYGKATNSGV